MVSYSLDDAIVREVMETAGPSLKVIVIMLWF
jgi:hypothetical protein